MNVSRPALRYHGGKWKLAPWIISNFPAHRVYVEPFGGGASVLLRKQRSYGEVYSDLDGEIVNVFRVLQSPDTAAQLETLLRVTPFARAEFELSYKPSPDPIVQAQRTIVRSFMGFGSAAASGNDTGFRANSNRSGTTPAHDWTNYPDRLAAFTHRLMGVVLETRDAVQVMQQHDSPETLHYVDPPYVLDTRSPGNKYCGKGYRFEMSDSDHEQLASALSSLVGMVVLSGYHGDLYDRLYGTWKRVNRAAFADGARKRVEVLWFNDAAWSASPAKGSLFGGAEVPA